MPTCILQTKADIPNPAGHVYSKDILTKMLKDAQSKIEEQRLFIIKSGEYCEEPRISDYAAIVRSMTFIDKEIEVTFDWIFEECKFKSLSMFGYGNVDKENKIKAYRLAYLRFMHS